MIEIAFLADHPEVIPALTNWFRAQWPDYYAGRTAQEVAQDFYSEARRSGLPVRLVAFCNGALAGTITLRERAIGDLPAFHPGLGGLFVLERYRGQGIGTMLVKAGMDLARDQGYYRVYATTMQARGILERLGWQAIQEFTHNNEQLVLYTCELGMNQSIVTKPAKRQAPHYDETVIAWLLDGDPSIRWQVMRDLTDAPAEQVAAERRRVATEGVGARLLALQGADGRWGGAAWNRGWNSTMHVLMLLREMGLDPDSEQAKHAVGLVRDHVTWKGSGPSECDDNPFFAGELEPCINGQVGAVGAYFGQDVRGIVDRLLSEQLPDGGWNCEAINGSMRSSFNTTICVLEALLEVELRFGGDTQVTAARTRGQEYLLERRLFRRKSTGAVIAYDRKLGPGDCDHPAWTRFAFPTWWHYDVLRGLEYLRRAGVAPDQRVAEAVDLVASRRDGDGRWSLEVQYPGEMPVEMDAGQGRPSRWITLRALRVLDWYSTSG